MCNTLYIIHYMFSVYTVSSLRCDIGIVAGKSLYEGDGIGVAILESEGDRFAFVVNNNNSDGDDKGCDDDDGDSQGHDTLYSPV